MEKLPFLEMMNVSINLVHYFIFFNKKIGLDPIWAGTANELTFINNFKMKLAVIIGVLHMSFGIMMKGLNAIHFRSKTDFFFEFLPQIIFMVSIFLWMDIMIIIKWVTNYSDIGNNAPSIITLMIYFPLKLGNPCPGPTDHPLFGTC